MKPSHLLTLFGATLWAPTCVYGAPTDTSKPHRSLDTSPDGTYAYLESRSVQAPANLTAGITSSNTSNVGDRPICFAPRPQPDDFKCTEALHKYLQSFDQSKKYSIQRNGWLPPFPGSRIYKVPREFTAGTCKIVIDVNHVFFSPGNVAGRSMKVWGEELIGWCVPNERYSGGGVIDIPFGQMRKEFVSVFLSVGSTNGPSVTGNDTVYDVQTS